MTRTRGLLALFAVVAALLVSFARPTFAQPTPEDPPAEPGASAEQEADAPADAPPAGEPDDVERRKEDAKKHFFRGIEHVQNDNWDAALAEFLRSRELYPGIASLKNAAVALRQLKRYAESLRMYEELLRDFGPSLNPEEKKTVDEAVVKLRENVGQIAVTSNQAGSTVVIDGQDRGVTPLAAPIVVDAGTHTVRVYQEGFVPFESQVFVAGEQRKTLKADLKALTESGRLRVVEAEGQSMEVVVDGAVVGQTPWEGALAVGTHTVFLKGADDMGTPPSAATVEANRTATLRLRAVELDATLRIEPTPSNARVDIDGVEVGNGVWEGRVKSGPHKIEVAAKGFVAYRRDVAVESGEREVHRVALERDLTDPMWRDKVFQPHLFVEVLGGPAFATTFGGTADSACDRGDCTSRSRPFGAIAGARGGYQLTSGLGVELFLGFLAMREDMVRTANARADQAMTSTDFSDSTAIAGPMAAASASYQFFTKTPLTFRVWVGAARVNASFANSGTWVGTIESSRVNPPQNLEFRETAAIAEESQAVWLPLVGPEVRFGYRFSKRFALDAGFVAMIFFPSETPRTGTDGNDRRRSLTDFQDGFVDVDTGTGQTNVAAARPGLLNLDNPNPADGFGTFFGLFPTVSARVDF